MANNQKLSPQGYNYSDEPTNTNPFFEMNLVVHDVPDITASATVDDTTGTPAVTVTKSGDNTNPNFEFAFSGIKGETGEQGATGATGAAGVSPAVTSTGSTDSGTLAGTITGADGTVINVYNGAQGEPGSAGAEIDTSQFVTAVSVTNENGIYTISQTKGEVTTEAGTVNVPEVDTTNILAEVTDSIVENTTNGYDYHTIKETEYNGTQNDVGSFYIARKQITNVNVSDGTITFNYIDQAGEMTNNAFALPTSDIPVITATASVDDTTGTPAVTVTKTGTDASPSFAFAFTGIKGEKGEQGATGATGADGISPTVTSTGSTESGALAGTITGADGAVINVYNGTSGGTSSESVAKATNSTLGIVKGFDTANVDSFSTLSTYSATAYIGDSGEIKILPPHIETDDLDAVNVGGVVYPGAHMKNTNGVLTTTLTQVQSDFPVTISGNAGSFGSANFVLSIGRILDIQVRGYWDSSTRENPGIIILGIDFNYQNSTSTTLTIYYYLTNTLSDNSITVQYNALYYSS